MRDDDGTGHRHIQLRHRHHRTRVRRLRRCESPKSACDLRWKRAGVGIWDMDYTTGALDGPRSSRRQYGLQPGTFGGTFEAFVERIHPDDRASVLETLAKRDEVRRRFLDPAPHALA